MRKPRSSCTHRRRCCCARWKQESWVARPGGDSSPITSEASPLTAERCGLVRRLCCGQAVGMAATVTVNDVLDGHIGLDIECLDRIYLNGYVPNLQVGGQVVSFMTAHLGNPIPSPAIMEKIGTAFRTVVRFSKDDRKIDRMRPYLSRQSRAGRCGVAAIGVAQEFQNVFAATKRMGHNGIPWFSFTKADRRVTCFYFYVWDADFGSAFIKICTYFPYPIKVWLNGHEWAKRQATQAE